MKIYVNGDERDVPDNSTVETLIEDLGLAAAICAAEVNRVVVPKNVRSDARLNAEDRVEIVTLVGGG